SRRRREDVRRGDPTPPRQSVKPDSSAIRHRRVLAISIDAGGFARVVGRAHCEHVSGVIQRHFPPERVENVVSPRLDEAAQPPAGGFALINRDRPRRIALDIRRKERPATRERVVGGTDRNCLAVTADRDTGLLGGKRKKLASTGPAARVTVPYLGAVASRAGVVLNVDIFAQGVDGGV